MVADYGSGEGTIGEGSRRAYGALIFTSDDILPFSEISRILPQFATQNATQNDQGPRCFLLRPCFIWWSHGESNPGPLECHSSALPTELWPLITRRWPPLFAWAASWKFREAESTGPPCVRASPKSAKSSQGVSLSGSTTLSMTSNISSLSSPSSEASSMTA